MNRKTDQWYWIESQEMRSNISRKLLSDEDISNLWKSDKIIIKGSGAIDWLPEKNAGYTFRLFSGKILNRLKIERHTFKCNHK
jgi:hypothetical protein